MEISELSKFGIEVAEQIAGKVRDIAKERSLGDELNTTGASGDSTKFADDFSELVIKDILKDFANKNPEEKILLISEETGFVELGNPKGSKGIFIILDPIDGSNNIRAWRTPAPAVSIGLAIGNLERLISHNNFDTIEVGVAVDIFNQRTYSTQLNSKTIVSNFGEVTTSPETDIKNALIGISFDYKEEKYSNVYSRVEKIMSEKKCQRRLGSSILDFCKVACGEYDSFISLGGKMGFYDLAAVKMLVENAGGVFEVLSGNTDFCIIKEIINSKNANLLGEHKYEVMASGNINLHNRLKELMSN